MFIKCGKISKKGEGAKILADHKNNGGKDNRPSVDEDYLDLLRYIEDKEDPYEDVYSDSSRDPGSYEDVYSDSSYEDVYIGRRKSSGRTYEDVYSDSSYGTSTQPSQPPRRKPDDDEYSDYEDRVGRRRPKKKKSKATAVLALVLCAVIAFGGILFVAANSVVGKFTKAEKIEHIEDVKSLASQRNVKNILLIGADKEKGGASRSDSIMIVSINKSTGKITVCSVLRDTHLDIPGKSEAKVNAAYSWGGANLLIQTIEQNFGIKIDEYATVNFEMFVALVDGIGGITVEVTEAEANYLNYSQNFGNEKRPDFYESGENVHLNGRQALWYVRLRKLDSDFMRAERQRKVLGCIFNDVKEKLLKGKIFELIDTAKEVAPYIETTLSTGDFWSVAFAMMSCITKSGMDIDKLLVSTQIPFEDTWWYEYKWDGSSIVLNLTENREMLYSLLYEDNTEEETESTEETE